MRRLAALLLFVCSLGLLCWLSSPAASRAPKPIKQRTPPLRLPRYLPGFDVVTVLAKDVDFAGCEDPKTTLIELLDQLSKVHRVTFDVNEKAFAAENLKDVMRTEIANPNAVPAMKCRLSTVLRKVLARVEVNSGATFLIRRDRVEITTGSAQRAEVHGKEHNGPLLPLVSLTADRRALEEVLAYVADEAERNIVFDPNVSDKATTPITAHLLNTPLDAALFLLADMAELSFVKIDNTFYLTSHERAKTMQAAWKNLRPDPARAKPKKKAPATKN
jgi:hypothetical protein